MKIALKFKLSLFTALVLCSASLLAQEENVSTEELPELKQPQHSELNLEEDKTLIMEVDSKPAKVTAPSATSNNAVNANAKPKTEKPVAKEKEEEDALNFNFLYYIIQRFKISDIVDD